MFEIGDIVKLKSGSPGMTVYESGGGFSKTVWFYEAKFHFQDFPDNVLIKA